MPSPSRMPISPSAPALAPRAAAASLYGKSTNGAILKEIPLQYKYSPGDTIYTSGHSLVFPPDIPLGTAGKAKIVNGSTNEIQVTLFQEFKAIRYVTIVHNDSFNEVEEFLK